MAQHDYVIENQTFPATRTDLNNALAAAVSQNSGATAPSTTYAYQLWYDTSTNKLKQRNADNDAWIDLFDVDQSADTASISTAAFGTMTADQLDVDNIRIDGNTISSTDTNGDIILDPNGTGNVGIGIASPSQILVVSESSTPTIQIKDGAASGTRISGRLHIGEADNLGVSIENSTNSYNDNCTMVFNTSPAAGTITERMRLTSAGELIIGDTITGVPTALAAARLHLDRKSEAGHGIIVENILQNYVGLAQKRVGTAGISYALYLINNGNQEVGTISFSNTGTAYNTSSDYRLKTAVNYDWDAITRLKQLKPAKFKWIADGDDAVPVDGFLAHEAATVVPESVIGTHNEVKTWTQQEIDDGDAPDGSSAGDNKLDEDGNTIPVMQGIDQSKLVPLLTKALIEAVEKIEALEVRITALETA